VDDAATTTTPSSKRALGIRIPHNLADPVKLLIGAGGIYGAFLFYGSLQEDVFRYSSSTNGAHFQQAWLLQVMEALANVVVAFLGSRRITSIGGGGASSSSSSSRTTNDDWKLFGLAGLTQVAAKACTSLALSNGLSFSVATLAKNGKMAPVLLGSLLLGNCRYTRRQYGQVAAIVIGTTIVSLGQHGGLMVENAGAGGGAIGGSLFLLLSLALDGATAGVQTRILVQQPTENDTDSVVIKQPTSFAFDFMFWTNAFLGLFAAVLATSLGEVWTGVQFCVQNPQVMTKIAKFVVCSAIGQFFIYYTMTSFDPLVLSAVTTSRKIFAVLLGFFFKGHYLSPTAWSGVTIAGAGILADLQDKFGDKSDGETTVQPRNKEKETKVTASRPAISRPRPASMAAKSASTTAPRPPRQRPSRPKSATSSSASLPRPSAPSKRIEISVTDQDIRGV